MTPDELGLIVLRIQEDDVHPRDIRKFLLAMKNDPEVRSNAGIAGRLATASPEEKRRHCLANVRFLLTDPALAPRTHPPTYPVVADSRMVTVLGSALLGPWVEHFRLEEGRTYRHPTAVLVRDMPKQPGKYVLRISEELNIILDALCTFWGVRGARQLFVGV